MDRFTALVLTVLVLLHTIGARSDHCALLRHIMNTGGTRALEHGSKLCGSYININALNYVSTVYIYTAERRWPAQPPASALQLHLIKIE